MENLGSFFIEYIYIMYRKYVNINMKNCRSSYQSPVFATKCATSPVNWIIITPLSISIEAMEEYWKKPRIVQWTQYLLDSYAHWVTQELIARDGTPADQAERLFNCPFAVVSHGRQDDPVFNYANQTALDLWEMSWHQFTQTPSRLSAEPVDREERARMLAQASTQGYLSDYRGVRISQSGKRFLVAQATVWNIQQPDGRTVGQAATFSKWTYL